MTNDWGANLTKLCIGGLVLYPLLKPEAQKGIGEFVSQLLDEWAASERRKTLAERLQNLQT